MKTGEFHFELNSWERKLKSLSKIENAHYRVIFFTFQWNTKADISEESFKNVCHVTAAEVQKDKNKHQKMNH